MIREYRTIEEVAGPLMLVRQVEGVKYDELGEIELENGEVRRCRVLEVNGRNVLVQLFDNAAGLNLSTSKVRFSGHGVELPVSANMLGRVFNGMGNQNRDNSLLLYIRHYMKLVLLHSNYRWHLPQIHSERIYGTHYKSVPPGKDVQCPPNNIHRSHTRHYKRPDLLHNNCR